MTTDPTDGGPLEAGPFSRDDEELDFRPRHVENFPHPTYQPNCRFTGTETHLPDCRPSDPPGSGFCMTPLMQWPSDPKKAWFGGPFKGLPTSHPAYSAYYRPADAPIPRRQRLIDRLAIGRRLAAARARDFSETTIGTVIVLAALGAGVGLGIGLGALIVTVASRLP